MSTKPKIVGVHLVEASVRVHLLEIDLCGVEDLFNWEMVTQEDLAHSEDNWQVPWDERQIGNSRWVFFLHELDVSKPLSTNLGEIPLPPVSPTPDHLRCIVYEAP